jgi:hypothetical protein
VLGGLSFLFFFLSPSSSFSFLLLKISIENLKGLPWDLGWLGGWSPPPPPDPPLLLRLEIEERLSSSQINGAHQNFNELQKCDKTTFLHTLAELSDGQQAFYKTFVSSMD